MSTGAFPSSRIIDAEAKRPLEVDTHRRNDVEMGLIISHDWSGGGAEMSTHANTGTNGERERVC